MIPIVALTGRPDVRKSTLFSHLTRIRNTLVTGFPGLARDRKYDQAEVEGRELICISTGGVDGTEEGVGIRMTEQSLLAIGEVDVVLPMVGIRAGLMPMDIIIAKHLHSREKLTFLVTNKTDSIDVDQATADLWPLGLGDIYSTATSHGRDVINLLERALPLWVDEISPQEEVDEDAGCWIKFEAEQNGEAEEEPEDDLNPQDLSIKLVIVGRPSVGKSTLINHILGRDRVVVYNTPSTIHDSIYIPMQRDECEYMFIDTAGVHKHGKITDVAERFSMIRTLQAIEGANVVLLVIGIREGISDQDLSLLGFILDSGYPLVTVVNKWDGLSWRMKERMKKTFDYHLDFIDFTRVHFISALHGSGVGNLFRSVYEAYDSAIRHVGTAMLTRIIDMATEDHQPPLAHDHRVRLKYAHAEGYDPPIMVIRGNQVRDLSDSYKHYLMDYFRKSLGVTDTPIRIQFKERKNPFANKRSTLTPDQMHKRKRLIKHIKRSK